MSQFDFDFRCPLCHEVASIGFDEDGFEVIFCLFCNIMPFILCLNCGHPQLQKDLTDGYCPKCVFDIVNQMIMTEGVSEKSWN